ncbi:MAG: ABC transporter permease, partial [Blastocatellia bacterium]
MQTLWQDLRYGARNLRRNLGVTVLAIIALALGIGGNTAIFSVVNAVLLRPLPYQEPDRIMRVWATTRLRGQDRTSFSFPKFTCVAEQNQTFEQVAAYVNDSFNLSGGDEPAQVSGLRVTVGLFDVLKARPALGRSFTAEEDRAGGAAVVILSYRLWQQRFNADPNIIGRNITLDNAPATIVGVMPAGFAFGGQDIDLWAPRVFELKEMPSQGALGVVTSSKLADSSSGFLAVIARLKPGQTRQSAQTDLEALDRRYKEQYPVRIDSEFGSLAAPLPEQVTSNIRPTLLILFGAVGFVLLIACANVANLLLAKTVERKREIAIRAALGASRSRLIRQFLTESVLLAAIAGLLGALLALWGVDLLVSLAAGSIPRAAEINIDHTVLAFTGAVALLTGIIFGLAPALRASRPDLNEALKESSRGAIGGWRRNRVRSAFVVAEVALSLVLLIGAGLLMRSFIRLQNVNPGFNPDNLLAARINLTPAKYTRPVQRRAFYQQALREISSLPGVVSLAATQYLPLGGSDSRALTWIEGTPLPPINERHIVSVNVITEDYFRTMGIPLLQGRFFTEQDDAEAPVVVIINESFARRFFPDQNPVGKRIHTGSAGAPFEVIGVVGDVHHLGLDTQSNETRFFTARQMPVWNMTVVARTEVAPQSLAGEIRQRVLAVDRDQ